MVGPTSQTRPQTVFPVIPVIPLLIVTVLQPVYVACLYRIGVGIADVTGPPAEVTFMGYANPEQRGQGIHLRQFSRAFVFQDEYGERMVFASVDCGMIGSQLRREVLRQLNKHYTDQRYTERNVILSGTHTHSTPGGFLMHVLFDISSWGFVEETFEALVEGIVLSIMRADAAVQPARVFVGRTDIHGININRSPSAYVNNPAEERNRYEFDTDHTLVQLKMQTAAGDPLAVLNWFAVHPTSMNNTNKLISSDNVGYASILFEQRMNGPEAILGRGPFIGAFASSNLGDVSPNTLGPRCELSGAPCDTLTSSCGSREKCFARGPGVDMFDSTAIIARRLFEGAWDLWQSDKHRELQGPVMAVHQYVDMPDQKAEVFDTRSNMMKQVRGCPPAMGYSFAAGTTDGVGAWTFRQGTRSENPFWNALRNFIRTPSELQVGCHGAKPILLTTGEMNFPLQWQPTIVSTQLATIGDFAIACVPGEFTTMAGRRLRETVFTSLREGGGPDPTPRSPDDVVIAGLCNTYSDYITTPEEYEVQRYEGASTIYGPHTLTLHLQQYRYLANSLRNRRAPPPGPEPPEMMNRLISLLPPVLFDTPVWSHEYGEVLRQPDLKYAPGDTVRAQFVSSHPRNNPRRGDTFFTISRLNPPNTWDIVATDANWETKMIWQRVSHILGSSTTDVEWTIPDWTRDGFYRISYFGHYKNVLGQRIPYNGTSYSFTVTRKPFTEKKR